MKKLALLCILSILCVGCGFHLRGASPAIARITISSNEPYSDFIKQLTYYFKSSPKADGDITLFISTVTKEKKLVGMGYMKNGNSLARILTYQLTIAMTYQLLDRNRNILINTESLIRSRNINILENQIIANDNVENNELVYRGIAKDIAGALYYRLNSQQIYKSMR